MTTFKDFDLPEALIHCLDHIGLKNPTPVQQKAIPFALQGRDILGSAQTGTGKTAAFGVPLVAKLMANPDDMAVVITPTRELAAQVHKAISTFVSKNSKILAALLIGGEPMPKQLNFLRRGPRIIIGTPGRINDHLARGTLKLDRTSYLVLDETDRMLDMGFASQIEKIVGKMPYKRQTMLFSATLPANILKLSKTYLNNPERVAIGSSNEIAKNIKQETANVTRNEKYPRLVDELNKRNGSIIVFVKSKFNADKMAKRLRKEGHDSDAIHGDLRHNKRERVIRDFRAQKTRILIATDIAARGLDIPHIEHVINFDLPQSPEDYIHRLGRTARAGANGEALCFISPDDDEKWFAICKLLNPDTDMKRPARKKTAGRGGKTGAAPGSKNKPKAFSFKKHSRNGKKPEGEGVGKPARASGPGKSSNGQRSGKPAQGGAKSGAKGGGQSGRTRSRRAA